MQAPRGGTGGLGADRATVIERGDRLNEFLPQLHAYLAEVGKGEGLTIVVDNAATASLIGSGMIQSIEKRFPVPMVRIMTASGEVVATEKGVISTQIGEFIGYIVETSPYSLWAMDDLLKGGGRYEQELNSAVIVELDGSVKEFSRQGRLWVVRVQQGEHPDCLVTVEYGHDVNSDYSEDDNTTVLGYSPVAMAAVADVKLLHSI